MQHQKSSLVVILSKAKDLFGMTQADWILRRLQLLGMTYKGLVTFVSQNPIYKQKIH